MRIERWVERVWFAPQGADYLVIALLSPLALMYGAVMLVRRIFTPKRTYTTPIISVGNLIVGGSGKTPMVIAIASRYDNVYVISRGYGRKSEGLVEVSRKGEVVCDVEQSGDEAMLMARALPKASVIVSEDRHAAIRLAEKRGAALIVLDDGFNRVDIRKLEILLEPERIRNILPFPAGPFREFVFCRRCADVVLKEGRDFKRRVRYENLTKRMVMLTAVARPERLEPYLPDGVVHRHYLPDHSYFDEPKVRELLVRYRADSLLVTEKDAVKLERYGVKLSLMRLELIVKYNIFAIIDHYRRMVRHET